MDDSRVADRHHQMSARALKYDDVTSLESPLTTFSKVAVRLSKTAGAHGDFQVGWHGPDDK